MRCTGAALALIACIGAGCGSSSEPAEPAAAQDKGTRFAACMRANGIGAFPDPDPSGELTIDGVLNGSSLDPRSPEWKQAIAACKDHEPPGFTGDDDVTDTEQERRLAFAQCMRDHGVEDFPDPARDEPLVNTNLIPSAAQPGGMDRVNAAMQACRGAAEEAMGK
jgi:hypothetical protein